MNKFTTHMILRRDVEAETVLAICDATEMTVANMCFKAKEQAGYLCIWWYNEYKRLPVVEM